MDTFGFDSIEKLFHFRCPSFSLLNSKESATVIINLELIGTNFIKFQIPEEGFSIASKGKIIVPDKIQKEIQEFDKEANEMFSYSEVILVPFLYSTTISVHDCKFSIIFSSKTLQFKAVAL